MAEPLLGRLRARSNRFLAHGPILLVWLWLFGTGLFALDFGPHWDEASAWLQPLERSIREGVPLPGRYNYPSLGYWLTLLATAPEVIEAGLAGHDVREHVIARIYEPSFRLRLRAVFMAVSSLAVLWMYALVWRWRGSRVEALVAACLLGFSWEFAYHARWIAPDALLLQFASLTMFALFRAVHADDGRSWLYMASACAGLACGTKYPGGLLMAPVGVATLMVASRLGSDKPRQRLIRTSLVAVVLFVGSFLVTTPGVVFDHAMFRANVSYEVKHYNEFGHVAHTVEAGRTHAALVLEYLAGHFLSPHGWIAWSGSALALAGLCAIWRERPALALMVVLFPVLHIVYMSTMVVFIVRNMLVDAPFIVILVARGASFVHSRLPSRVARTGFASVGFSLLLLNAAFLGWAAERTRHRSVDRSFQELARHVSSSRDSVFLLTTRIRAGLERIGALDGLENVVSTSAETHTHVVALASEAGRPDDLWKLGTPSICWFGPYEINLDYYPTAWNQRERILVTPIAIAEQD